MSPALSQQAQVTAEMTFDHSTLAMISTPSYCLLPLYTARSLSSPFLHIALSPLRPARCTIAALIVHFCLSRSLRRHRSAPWVRPCVVSHSPAQGYTLFSGPIAYVHRWIYRADTFHDHKASRGRLR